MQRILSAYEPHAYAIVRIIVGLLIVCHGLQKAVGAFGGVIGTPAPLFSLIGIAGCLRTRTRFDDYHRHIYRCRRFPRQRPDGRYFFIGHFPQDFWPIMNQGEQAVLYCLVFLYIATRGPGIWSVDIIGTATH